MKIFHHNDNDGKAAAAMLYLLAKKELLIDLNKEDFIEVNYNSSVPSADLIEEDEIVYIVDYSFTSATINILKEICNKSKYVMWLDHHQSSLEVQDIAEKICSYMELDMNRSGALIAYDLFIRGKEYDNGGISYLIKLVDDYDRWVHNDKNSMLFNNGSVLYDTHPMSDIWVNHPIDVIERGKIIKEYRDITNHKITEKNSYEITLCGHKCIVLNTPEFSSQVFADYYDKYKFAIRFNFDGYNYQYSIYSSLEDIDCSQIAKVINPKGGGHRGAAGFVSNKIVFKPNIEYVIRNGKIHIRFNGRVSY